MKPMEEDDRSNAYNRAEAVVAALTLRAATLIPSGCVPRCSGSYGYHRSSRLASRKHGYGHRLPSFSAVSKVIRN